MRDLSNSYCANRRPLQICSLSSFLFASLLAVTNNNIFMFCIECKVVIYACLDFGGFLVSSLFACQVDIENC